MALETLQGATLPTHVDVDHATNQITFTIQNGPVREAGGRNGGDLEDLIIVARKILGGLNDRVPCRENSLALTKLDEALHWLDARTRDRKRRGVEGTSAA